MLSKQDFVQGLEDYKQKTDLFSHAEQRVQQTKEHVRIVQKARRCAKNSKLVFKQQAKD